MLNMIYSYQAMYQVCQILGIYVVKYYCSSIRIEHDNDYDADCGCRRVRRVVALKGDRQRQERRSGGVESEGSHKGRSGRACHSGRHQLQQCKCASPSIFFFVHTKKVSSSSSCNQPQQHGGSSAAVDLDSVAQD